jgi:nucleoside-diphosphate-sugar epimerase
MRILVIGGTGMIGPGIVHALWIRGCDLTVLHRGKTTATLHASIKTIRGDRRRGCLDDLLAAHRFDVIVDLACFQPRDALDLLAVLPRGQRVVVASSVLVHGGGVPRPIHEGSPVVGLSAYATAKIEIERTLADAGRAGRIRATVVRLGTCYREGCYLDGQIFEDTYWLYALKSRRLSILADLGNAAWSALHVSDAGEAIAKLIAADSSIGQTVLVANPNVITWNDYYALTADCVGGSFIPRYIPADWIVEQLGTSSFLHEMSRWDQTYNLAKLKGLIGPFGPARELRSDLPRIAKAYADSAKIRATRSTRRAEQLAALWQADQV